MIAVLKTQARIAVAMVIAMTLLVGLAYPLAMTGIAQLVFPSQADGSLIEDGDTVVGSELIGQSFIDDTGAVLPGYFRGRPSAVGYDASASGASNLGPTSGELHQRVEQVAAQVRTENGLPNDAEIPIDLVTDVR